MGTPDDIENALIAMLGIEGIEEEIEAAEAFGQHDAAEEFRELLKKAKEQLK